MFVPIGHIPRYDDASEVRWGRILVDTARCTGCRMCVRACPSSVLVVEEQRARMVAHRLAPCIACGDCVAVCPDGVISLVQSYRYGGAYETRDRGDLQPPRL
jgi:ferredoxin